MFLCITIAKLESELAKVTPGQTVGFVPTMGALHPGHQSLIERAVAENELVVVSIFVNPLQFAPHEDLGKYPRPLEQDRQICEHLGVKILFVPPVAEMGISEGGTTVVVPPSRMTSVLCGQYRPGHFQGVATIVTKLLNIVRPTIAYFGQKDAQQLAIIRRVVQDLNLRVIIKPCPIVREDSGLAYSSRNQYLSPRQKQEASALYRSLRQAKQAFIAGERNANQLLAIVEQALVQTPAIKLQYVQLVEPNTLMPLTAISKSGLLAMACYLEETRLIDNIILQVREPIIAIDGPAGAGKSTISRRVAHRLGLVYLDTGAMYRAITWLVGQKEIEIDDQEAVASLVQTAALELLPAENLHSPTRVKINGRDVTDAIRTPEVTAKVSQIAAQAAVRQKLVKLQQKWGEKGGLVAEGRDIGTNVFPDAELKIFLTASVEERARRRLLDLRNQGEIEINLLSLQQEIEQRDYLDTQRPLSPLKKADDAIEVNTDGLSIEQVTDKIMALAHFW